MTKIVFLDTETTGLDPLRHELLEVGMIVRVTDFADSDKTVHFSLNIDDRRADPSALEVNRYYDRQKDLQAVLVPDERAGRWLSDTLEKAVIVGNNPQFDLRFIEAFLRRNTNEEVTAPWNYHPVDLKALVAGTHMMGPPPWSTGKVALAADVPIPDGYHSALVDAKWNRDVYDSIMAFHGRPALPNGTYTGRMSCARPNLSNV